MQCHYCNQELDLPRKVGRHDMCPKCGSALRCCLNCRFYEPNSSNQCREPEAELVSDKAAPNFCEYFQFGDRPGSSQSKKAEDARKKLNALFNTPKSQCPEDSE